MVILSLCGKQYADPKPEGFLDRWLVRLGEDLKARVLPGPQRPRAGAHKPA